MEKLSKLAYRYANALLRALEQNSAHDIDRAQVALSAFTEAWRTNKPFRDFVLNPLVPTTARRKVVEQSLAVLAFPEQITRFITIVFDRNRAEFIVEMNSCFSQLVDRRRKIVDVKITSALHLSDSDKDQIAAKVRHQIQGTPRYHFFSKPELIGGLVIEFEGKVLDGSLRARLAQMQKELTR